MKGNVHLVNLECGYCFVYRYKTYIHFVANKMNGYLQFSIKSTAKAILSSIFLEFKKCHIKYVGKAKQISN